ncbi:MAG: IS66 family insertion sequence element accessory protein TnpB [Lachnospiraceae bacterium]|nr:IS66 family insertion sequence element accessory protein TnpB [Lachnospiraceae bacterium]
MNNKITRRTDEEWLAIIDDCRLSGLSDRNWCQEHDISLSSFYYTIRRLRKKACRIPESSSIPVAKKQEIVQLDFNVSTDYDSVSLQHPGLNQSAKKTETTVRITFHGIQIEITNAVANDAVYHTLSALLKLC